MKKIIIMIMAAMLVSCNGEVEEVDCNGEVPYQKAMHFNYKGHKYIKFSSWIGKYTDSSVIHDPDCECFKNK